MVEFIVEAARLPNDPAGRKTRSSPHRRKYWAIRRRPVVRARRWRKRAVEFMLEAAGLPGGCLDETSSNSSPTNARAGGPCSQGFRPVVDDQHARMVRPTVSRGLAPLEAGAM